MRYSLYVAFDRFYVSELRAMQPELADRGLVVHRSGAVFDACQDAQSRGVRPGMTLKAAKAILSGASFIPYDTFAGNDGPYREARDRWLDRCVPYADAIEPEESHAAWLDLTPHPRPEEIARKVCIDLMATGRPLRAAAAPAKWVAKLFADSGLTLDDYPDWRASLLAMPVDALRPLEEAQRARLAFLGCKRVADVAWMELQTLRGQFGGDGLRAHQAARGLLHEPIRQDYPAGVVRDSLVFEPAESSLERLNLALGDLAERMGSALAQSDLSGHLLEVVVAFEPEDAAHPGVARWKRRFVRPIFDSRTLRVALRLMLDRKLKAPIASLRVLLGELQAASTVQADLFRGLPLGAREQALLEAAASFGRGTVLAAGDVSSPRAQRVLTAWRQATGWVG